MYHVNDRAGHISVKIDPKKITGVVRTNARDHIAAFTPQNETTLQIGHNVAAFLLREWKNGAIPKEFLPLQSGVGTLPMRYWVHWVTTRTFQLSPCLRR